MPDAPKSLTFERTIDAPVAHLYSAFTNATSMREWLADIATTSPKAGGYWFLAWNDGHYASGRFTELVKNERVAMTWRDGDDGPASRVTVDLKPADKGTAVRVTHHELDPGLADDYRHAWEASLENLDSVLTEGPDVRITRRPMLGIFVGEFNEKIAAAFNVPTDKGIRLDNVLEGMGAAAAGLQGNDVIVEIDDVRTDDWFALNHALERRQAGDTVQVTFYRDGRRLETAMTLSGRPLPDIPPTAAALADAVQERLDAAYRTYVEVLAAVPEDVANRRPAPDEWSVNETLAHLIHSVRGNLRWIDDLIGGEEPHYDDWGGNNLALSEGTVVAYGSLQGLMDELSRAHKELVAVLRRLPDGFVARPGRYWRLAWSLLEGTAHLDTHLEQIKAAVAPAPEPA